MPNLTKKGALSVTRDLDRIANLVTTEAATLGLSDQVAAKFATQCDLIADRIERTAGIDPKTKTALTGFDPVKEPGFDPETIGKETGGPLEQKTPQSYMTGEFDQQENRELRELQEAGSLGANVVNGPQSPRPGVQASAIKSLGATGSNLSSVAVKLASQNRALSVHAVKLAKGIMAVQQGVIAGTLTLPEAAMAYKAANQVLQHLQGEIKAADAGKLGRVASLALSIVQKAAKKAEDDEDKPEDEAEVAGKKANQNNNKIEAEDESEEDKSEVAGKKAKKADDEDESDEDESEVAGKKAHGYNLSL